MVGTGEEAAMRAGEEAMRAGAGKEVAALAKMHHRHCPRLQTVP